MNFKNRTVLITGGSSGIGLELARLFAKENAKIILLASSADKLNQAGALLEKEFGQKPLLIAKDLSKAEAPREIYNELHQKMISLDILVNNAGFGMFGDYGEASYETALQMIAVNVTSLAALTRLFLPDMISRKFGKVMNVASTAAFQGIPREALYAASKAFVLTFSEGLSKELEGTGVTATCLCPGPTATPFFERGTIGASRSMERTMMTSAAVAKAGMNALKKGKPVEIAGFRNKFLIGGERLIPRAVAVTIAGKFVDVRHS